MIEEKIEHEIVDISVVTSNKKSKLSHAGCGCVVAPVVKRGLLLRKSKRIVEGSPRRSTTKGRRKKQQKTAAAAAGIRSSGRPTSGCGLRLQVWKPVCI